MCAPAKGFPLPGGKLSSEARLMREPTGIVDGPSLRPLIRHLLRKCHLPPCGGKALWAATWGRPYGGAPVRSLSLRGGPQARRGNPSLRPKKNGFPRPLRGLGMTGRANAVRPCMAADRSPPHPALRATFPPGGRSGGRPRKKPPLKREVAFAKQMPEGFSSLVCRNPQSPPIGGDSPLFKGGLDGRPQSLPHRGRCPSARTGAEGALRRSAPSVTAYAVTAPPQGGSQGLGAHIGAPLHISAGAPKFSTPNP